MPRLVEDAGDALSAGWLARVVRLMSLDRDTLPVGDREVGWVLRDDVVNVTHAASDRTVAPLRYRVRLTFTELPSGGLRWWWQCPACQKRVADLYLLAGRDRLACRRCCTLLYASQYPSVKKRRRKRRPVVVVTRERKVWTMAGGWVVLSRRTVRC